LSEHRKHSGQGNIEYMLQRYSLCFCFIQSTLSLGQPDYRNHLFEWSSIVGSFLYANKTTPFC